MGKAEVGTPKYLANKMKSKGLQKLRWYCQMCEKQCRDENGFKCHTTSESHQRQLLLFADNSGKYIHSFSKDFADGYVELLRRRFGTKRVSANKVYQEYISHKDHLHMNATRWLTLSDFAKWLGRTGQATVDETETGWFIAYIDRSPEVLERQAKSERKDKQDKDDEERLQDFIAQQVERAKATTGSGNVEEVKAAEFKRDNEEDKISLAIRAPKVQKEPQLMVRSLSALSKRHTDDLDDTRSVSSTSSKRSRASSSSCASSSSSVKPAQPLSALDEIMRSEETRKERNNRKDYWLAEGIVVKLITKSLGDKYYKQKAVVVEVIERYAAKVKLLETGGRVKVDQSHLETVIPAAGKAVRVLNGAYRDCTATLLQLDEHNFCVSLELTSGSQKGRKVHGVQYEDVSKIFHV